MVNKKDFEYQYNLQIEKEGFFKEFHDTPIIKRVLFEEFTETKKHPDLHLFQLSYFESEKECYRIQRGAKALELNNKHDNSFREQLTKIENEFIEEIQNKTLDNKFYSHCLTNSKTWNIINTLIDSYYRAIENIIRSDYKDELVTSESFIKAIDRNLNELTNTDVKQEILKPFYKKEYSLRHHQSMSKYCISDEQLNSGETIRRFKTFSQELDNYLFCKIKELSTEIVEVKYIQITNVLIKECRIKEVKPKIIKRVVEKKEIKDHEKIIWIGTGTQLANDMAYLWEIDNPQEIKANTLNKWFVFKENKRKLKRGDIQNAIGHFSKALSPFKDI